MNVRPFESSGSAGGSGAGFGMGWLITSGG